MTVEPNMADFAVKMRAARDAAGMSLEAVALRAGMTKSHIWELEQGKAKNPTIRAIWGIAGALSLSPSYLLGLNVESPPIDPLAIRLAVLVDDEINSRLKDTQS